MSRNGTARATAAAVAVAVVVSLAGAGVSLWAVATASGSILASALSGAVVVSFAVVGAVVVAARPGNKVGWLMVLGGTLWSLGNAGTDLAVLGIVADPGRVPAAGFFAVAGSSARAAGWYVVTVGVPLVFPDGHLAGLRWRPLARVAAVVVVAGIVGPIVDPHADLDALGAWRNPVAPGGWLQLVNGAAFLLSFPLGMLAAVGAVAQLVLRWRRGGPSERQQLGLFAAAAACTVVGAPVAFVVPGAGWVFSAAALPLPFAIGFAVLTRGLYDLRTAANRTLLWLTLSAVVAGGYAVVIAGVGTLLHARAASWLPWVAAAVVALTFAPLRDALQRAVNRLTYGRWDEPYEVLSSLGQRLEAGADVDRLIADVVAELRGLGLRGVAVRDEHGRLLAGESDDDDGVAVPLTAYGERVGTLHHRPPEPPLRSRDARLLDDLAGHLGGVLHAHELTADLQRARESLVLAREEERRRLRRDLHDGLGPALAGHLLRLDVLAGKVAPGSAARADVDRLRDEVRTTVLEVRRVVEGLRPPALDELGLAGALTQITGRLTTGSPVAVDLRIDELPPLSAALEVAVLRIVSEAVTNVVRHSGARTCAVTVCAAAGRLRITVTDDGRGLPDSPGPAGHGLQTMRERAEELRGDLRIVSVEGTSMVAEIPLPRTTASSGRARRRAAPVAVR